MTDTTYDGFISYSHAADNLLAPRLQKGLQRIAKLPARVSADGSTAAFHLNGPSCEPPLEELLVRSISPTGEESAHEVVMEDCVHHYLQDLVWIFDGEIRSIPLHEFTSEGVIPQGALSPTGDLLAVLASGNYLGVFDTRSGDLVTPGFVELGIEARLVAWSGDASQIFMAGESIVAVRPQTGHLSISANGGDLDGRF